MNSPRLRSLTTIPFSSSTLRNGGRVYIRVENLLQKFKLHYEQLNLYKELDTGQLHFKGKLLLSAYSCGKHALHTWWFWRGESFTACDLPHIPPQNAEEARAYRAWESSGRGHSSNKKILAPALDALQWRSTGIRWGSGWPRLALGSFLLVSAILSGIPHHAKLRRCSKFITSTLLPSLSFSCLFHSSYLWNWSYPFVNERPKVEGPNCIPRRWRRG